MDGAETIVYLLGWLAGHWPLLLGDIVAIACTSSALAGLVAVVLWRPGEWLRVRRYHRPPVTVLKPLCGAEKRLYENLRSCCEQDYPVFQVVFGVRYIDDPAVAVVRQLQAELPQADLTLVVDDTLIGSNYKVSNLANMVRAARYDMLVMADSDIRVGRDYLDVVTEPLERDNVGLATCLYRAQADATVCARLTALFVNGWFAPSVLFSQLLGWHAFGFGATLVVRHSVLAQMGGFSAMADHIADDYMLGALVRAAGYKVVLADYVVETTVSIPTWDVLLRHEVRQARALRVLQPVGYAFTFITYGIPLTAAMLVLTGPQALALTLFAITIVAKCATQVVFSSSRKRAVADSWLVPLRDLLSLTVWAWSFVGRGVHWRGRRFTIRRNGRLVERMVAPWRSSKSFYLAQVMLRRVSLKHH